jgi:hypothetical protein
MALQLKPTMSFGIWSSDMLKFQYTNGHFSIFIWILFASKIESVTMVIWNCSDGDLELNPSHL